MDPEDKRTEVEGGHCAYVCRGSNSETRFTGQTISHFLATGRTTDDQFCLVEEIAKRGESIPLHRHADDFESFYVLDGSIRFYLDGEAGVNAGTGSFVHVPAGRVHGFRIASESARYLILTTPRHGDFYRAISDPAQLPSSYETDWDRIILEARNFGIEIIGDLPDN